MPEAPDRQARPGPQRATFILRLWRERPDPDQVGWRGTVEYLQGDQRQAVADAATALTLLASWLQTLETCGGPSSGQPPGAA